MVKMIQAYEDKGGKLFTSEDAARCSDFGYLLQSIMPKLIVTTEIRDALWKSRYDLVDAIMLKDQPKNG